MLVTPSNGIMFLASLTFLAIGLMGWLCFPKRDRSSKLWMLAFITAGLAPLIGAALSGPSAATGFVVSACILAVSFLLFGLALKALHQNTLILKEYFVFMGVGLSVYGLLLSYSVATGTEASQIIMFAIGNGLAAAWATQQAMLLSRRRPTSFAHHLVIIFGLQTIVLLLRVPQVMRGDARRLWETGTSNELILVLLCLLGIIKAISYFALRYEEIRERLAEESAIIRDQAAQLARKNADIASAMHVVPVACVVTQPSLEILYLNAEARRIFGDHVESKSKVSDWAVGLQGQNEVSLASARHMFVRSPLSPVIRAMEVTVNELDGTSQAAQRVFSFKPVKCSRDIIESIWMHIPRIDNRTWLVCDRSGIVLSAQSAWGEVLGACAVFHSPQLHLGGLSHPADARGIDFWASLKKFSAGDPQVTRARDALLAGNATSLMVRNIEGAKLSCGLTPVRCEGMDEPLWLIELSYKTAPVTYSRRKKSLSEQATTAILAASLPGGATNDQHFTGVRFDR